MPRHQALLLCVALTGCVRGFEASPDSVRPRDGAPAPDSVRPDLPFDSPGADSSTPDSMPDSDAPPCATVADTDTVALFTFEGSGLTETDVTGNHTATLTGAGVDRAAGPPGCGQALRFSSTSPISRLVIPDHPDWQLAQGSVDFWMRITSYPATEAGLVTRDADQVAKPGHFAVFLNCSGEVVVRLQLATNPGYQRCSAPLATGTWHHVGINFGLQGLELVVDGTVASAASVPDCKASLTFHCDATGATTGINGNNNPWVVGASSHQSNEGADTPLTAPFDGRIDSLRISKARRAFAP